MKIRKIFNFLAVPAILVPLCCCSKKQTQDYSQHFVDFNKDWYFKGEDDIQFSKLNLPHDYAITKEFSLTSEGQCGYLLGGKAIYYKEFTLPKQKNANYIINFDGVMADSIVYVNGTRLGECHYGYAPYSIDITDYVTADNKTVNNIVVLTRTEPYGSRFYCGAGIYRDVTLTIVPNTHIADDSICVLTPDISSGKGTTSISVDIVNNSKSNHNTELVFEIYDKDGTLVSTNTTSGLVEAKTTKTVSCSLNVDNPHLWSTSDPYLYTAKCLLKVDGTTIDHYQTKFGYRYFEFNENGFFLNGKATKINGACMHADQGALGMVVNKDALYRQFGIMKDMGVNAIRTSHNIPDRKVAQCCDELGLILMEELTDVWMKGKDNVNDFHKYFRVPLTEDNLIIRSETDLTWSQYSMEAMVRRDRNSPSLMIWSIGNEIWDEDFDPGHTAKDLIDHIVKYDTSRYVTLADNKNSVSYNLKDDMAPAVKEIVERKDVRGIAGYNYGWTECNDYKPTYVSGMDRVLNDRKILVATETASHVNSRGVYTCIGTDSGVCEESKVRDLQYSGKCWDGNHNLTSYDDSRAGHGLTAHETIYRYLVPEEQGVSFGDKLAGQFIWTGFDYIGEPWPYCYDTMYKKADEPMANSSYFGAVDTCGFPKDTFYMYRSQWNQNDYTAHMVTGWDENNQYVDTNGFAPVHIYSNAKKVELYLDSTKVAETTRTVNTTPVGHKYFTYTPTVETGFEDTVTINNSKHTRETGTELFTRFNVKFDKTKTISIKAYDENNNLITNASGLQKLAPRTDDKHIELSANKTTIPADDNSLSYITIDLKDQDRLIQVNGLKNTDGSDKIKSQQAITTIDLEGEGEIVAVDNGCQYTYEKYQNHFVLNSDRKHATITTFSGKALVIVKSNNNPGTIKLTVNWRNHGSWTITLNTTPINVLRLLNLSTWF